MPRPFSKLGCGFKIKKTQNKTKQNGSTKGCSKLKSPETRQVANVLWKPLAIR